MKTIKKLTVILPLALTALAFTATMALAGLSVEAAKKQGLVGERTDGMLGIVSAPTPELTQLVDTTNAQRLDKYKEIAKKRGTDLNHVEAYAGKKLISLAAPGEFVMNPAGGWQKK
jgi:uncharacterized protein YdbL (DUF1318 family)